MAALIPAIILLLASTCLSIQPNDYYDTYGPNILFTDEGAPVQTGSGKDFLSGVSVEICAQSCLQVYTKCECCNSFAYNPNLQMCYFKKRSNISDLNHYIGSNGYQSYNYYGSDHYHNTLKPWALPEYLELPPSDGLLYFFDMAFVSNGNGQNAVDEGQPLKTSTGKDFLTQVSAAECGDECLGISECDGFAYNGDQEGGKCFLKTGYPKSSKFQSQLSSEGWTYYWRDLTEKCFCPCKSEFRCVGCAESGCTETF